MINKWLSKSFLLFLNIYYKMYLVFIVLSFVRSFFFLRNEFINNWNLLTIKLRHVCHHILRTIQLWFVNHLSHISSLWNMRINVFSYNLQSISYQLVQPCAKLQKARGNHKQTFLSHKRDIDPNLQDTNLVCSSALKLHTHTESDTLH